MDEKEREMLCKKLNKLGIELWYIKHLGLILNELIENNSGNICSSGICALSDILNRTISGSYKQMDTISRKLGI